MADEEEKVLPAEAIRRAISENSSGKLSEAPSRTIREIVESVPKLEDIVKVPLDHYSRKEADAKERPDWLPKTEKTLKKWRKCYEVIQSTEKEMQEKWENLATKSPKVTLAEHRDAILENLGISYDPKTIGRIKYAGDKGWLQE